MNKQYSPARPVSYEGVMRLPHAFGERVHVKFSVGSTRSKVGMVAVPAERLTLRDDEHLELLHDPSGDVRWLEAVLFALDVEGRSLSLASSAKGDHVLLCEGLSSVVTLHSDLVGRG